MKQSAKKRAAIILLCVLTPLVAYADNGETLAPIKPGTVGVLGKSPVSIKEIIGNIKKGVADFRYDRRNAVFRVPTIPGVAGWGAGWAVVVDWGFAGSGLLTDGAFPRLKIELRNVDSPETEQGAKAAGELAAIVMGTKTASAADAFDDIAEGREAGMGFVHPLDAVLKGLSPDVIDNPWSIFTLKFFLLLKEQLFRGEMVGTKQLAHLGVLWELSRLSMRLFFSLNKQQFCPEQYWTSAVRPQGARH